jgi:hypothetical protein
VLRRAKLARKTAASGVSSRRPASIHVTSTGAAQTGNTAGISRPLAAITIDAAPWPEMPDPKGSVYSWLAYCPGTSNTHTLALRFTGFLISGIIRMNSRAWLPPLPATTAMYCLPLTA